MKIRIIIGVLCVIGIVYFVSRNNNGNNQKTQVAKQIQLEELESVITKLLDGKLKYDFFGITSDGITPIDWTRFNPVSNRAFISSIHLSYN